MSIVDDFEADTATQNADDALNAGAPDSPGVDRDDDGVDDRLEMLLTALFALAAASVARKVTGRIWKATTGRTPPASGKDGNVDLTVIVMWGALAGATAGVAKALAERQARRIAQSRRSA